MANSDYSHSLNPMSKPTVSRSAEDYLKAILQLESARRRVSTSAIAAQLGVSQPSVTRMTKKLAADGLVVRVPYRGVTLTETGRRVALEVLRHHRLLELFLVGRARPAARRGARRGRPARARALGGARGADRRGARLPDARPARPPDPGRRSCGSTTAERRSLLEVAPGERDDGRARARPRRRAAALPRRARARARREVEVVAQAPFDGPITLRSRTGEHAIARELAGAIAGRLSRR